VFNIRSKDSSINHQLGKNWILLIIPIYAKASINKILILVRIRIFELSVQEQLQSDPLVGQIKVDESYFGARRVKGRRGMVPEVKQLYLMISKIQFLPNW
jgi:hypothetical protein